MQRNFRQKKIIEIIKNKEIETQQELCAELAALQMDVTQATVSRDVRELHLYKIKGKNNRYHYAVSEWQEPEIPEKMLSLFRTCVVKIQTVGNTVVVKTLNGNGGNAGAVIDTLNYPEIVGTIAGDDTVFSLCETPDKARTVHSRLIEIIKK